MYRNFNNLKKSNDKNNRGSKEILAYLDKEKYYWEMEGKKVNMLEVPLIIDYKQFKGVIEKLDTINQINEKIIKLNRTYKEVREFYKKYQGFPDL